MPYMRSWWRKNLGEGVRGMGSKRAIAEDLESIPWEEVYPDFNGSVALRGARKRETLTQKELARLVGVGQTHISEMEHGKRPIGKDMARRLAKVLKVNYRFFFVSQEF
jgi:DNA-binding XRE family transcriptional regulator